MLIRVVRRMLQSPPRPPRFDSTSAIVHPQRGIRGRVLALAAATFAAGTLPLAARAQQPDAGQTAATCTYDRCGLRLAEGAVLQGIEGQRVGRLALFSNVSTSVPWLSDSARRYAGSARSAHNGAASLRILSFAAQVAGAVLYIKAVQDANDRADDAAGEESADNVSIKKSDVYTSVGLSIGGAVIGVAAAALDSHARNLLSRAVWWHNRELARQ